MLKIIFQELKNYFKNRNKELKPLKARMNKTKKKVFLEFKRDLYTSIQMWAFHKRQNAIDQLYLSERETVQSLEYEKLGTVTEITEESDGVTATAKLTDEGALYFKEMTEEIMNPPEGPQLCEVLNPMTDTLIKDIEEIKGVIDCTDDDSFLNFIYNTTDNQELKDYISEKRRKDRRKRYENRRKKSCTFAIESSKLVKKEHFLYYLEDNEYCLCPDYCFLTTNKEFARWKIPVNWLVKTRFSYKICKKISAHFCGHF